MAFFKFRTRTSEDLKKRGLISDAECRQLEAAYDFLLRVRNELHYQVEQRAADVLLKSLQPTIAHYLGYTDRSPSRRLERFMRDTYTHLRNIYLITRTLEQRLAFLPQPQRLPSVRRLIRTQLQKTKEQRLDGFKILDAARQQPRLSRSTPALDARFPLCSATRTETKSGLDATYPQRAGANGPQFPSRCARAGDLFGNLEPTRERGAGAPDHARSRIAG
jgi:hypothetical protein